jgi:integrase
VKTVKPEAERVVYYDELQAGFVLVVEPSGHKSYKLIYRLGRRPRWLSIASVRHIGLKEARAFARDKWADVIKGRDPQSEKIAARRAGTFEELAERYVEEHAKKRNKSWEQADQLVRRYLLPRWGKLAARDISRGDVRAVHRTLAPVLGNQVLAAASVIFSWAIKNEVADVAVNPCHGIERNATQSRERVLSDRELPIFWRAFDELDLVRSMALKMILLTGQRPGEVAHMLRDHLEIGRHKFTDANGRSFEAGGAWWTLPGRPDPKLGWPGTKNGQSHRVWLPKIAVAILDELDEGRRGLVFTTARGYAVGHLDGAMREVCNRIGITKPDAVRPHDLRRSMATLAASLGFGRQALDRLLNHVDGGVGAIYDRFSYQNEARRIAEAVSAKITALIGGEAAGKKIVRFGRQKNS